MPYAVQADITPARITQAILAQLTDDTGGGQVNAAVVTAELTAAAGIIDSYCRQRYTTPLQTSEMVKRLNVDIAVYLLFVRKDRVSDSVKQTYLDAIAFLKDVASGRASLDQPAGATPQTSGGAPVVTEVEEKFSDENLDGFV